MVSRRAFVFAVSALAACAPPPESNDAIAVRVRLLPTGAGYEIRVGDEVVEPSGLEDALMRHAASANPSIPSNELRRDVPIYVGVDPGTPDAWVDDLLPILMRFERSAVIAEDRRR